MTRVLIADDNRQNLYLLESILKGNGYDVIQASNGAEALSLARRSPPDLIITDILMPVMDGFELCRQWRADDILHTIPFIFYTATYTDPKDEKFAMNLGADRFLIKPQKPDVLIQEIREVLEESGRKNVPATKPAGDEREVLRQYNEVLFRKLEKKVLQLEAEIAERKAAHQQREEIIRELEAKNAELASFTYTVSHELRGPLITIKGFAGLIAEDTERGLLDPEELTAHAQRVSAAVDTLESLLADLLRLSRAGHCVNPPQRVQFGTIVQEALEILKPQIEDRGIRVESAPALPEVSVDHARMREVLINLIENAIRFSGSRNDPVIRITAERNGDTTIFSVQDNGIGIDPQYLSRIFNVFEKLDRSGQGTGVGLAITQRIIEAHGGKIWAESEGPGRGTTIRFTLPVLPVVSTDNHNNR